MSYKVLRDGNGSSLIRVIGLGDYMPLKDHQAMVTECEEKSKAIFDIMAERDALAAQVEAIRKVVNENSIDSVIIYQAKRILRQGSAGTWLKDSNVNGGKRQGGEK